MRILEKTFRQGLIAIAVLFVLPWLDRSKVRSIRYKGWMSKVALVIFAISFVVLGYIGGKPATELYTIIGQLATVVYFAYFIALPFITKYEETKPEPDRVTG